MLDNIEMDIANALDPQEALLWTIMRKFEEQALAQYAAHVPVFASEAKRTLAATLQMLAPTDAALAESMLAGPMEELIEASAVVDDDSSALVIQGLVLERVRQVVYSTLAASPGATERTRVLAASAAEVSSSIAREVPALFAECCDRSGAIPFMQFTAASDEVLHRLDAVGEGVDAIFAERFELHFAEIVADFVADLVPTCTGLGMDRRKVMSHLAAALMGL